MRMSVYVENREEGVRDRGKEYKTLHQYQMTLIMGWVLVCRLALLKDNFVDR